MKKGNMTKLALLGLTSGLIITSQAQATEENTPNQIQPAQIARGCGSKCSAIADNNSYSSSPSWTSRDDNPNHHPNADLSKEDEFMLQLNERGKALYLSLDAEGKALARKLGNSGDYNDKNEAVKAAAQKVMEKKNSNQKISNKRHH